MKDGDPVLCRETDADDEPAESTQPTSPAEPKKPKIGAEEAPKWHDKKDKGVSQKSHDFPPSGNGSGKGSRKDDSGQL